MDVPQLFFCSYEMEVSLPFFLFLCYFLFLCVCSTVPHFDKNPSLEASSHNRQTTNDWSDAWSIQRNGVNFSFIWSSGSSFGDSLQYAILRTSGADVTQVMSALLRIPLKDQSFWKRQCALLCHRACAAISRQNREMERRMQIALSIPLLLLRLSGRNECSAFFPHLMREHC